MFHSTRGNKKVSASEAILNGLAEDGGLYVIDELPKIDYHTLIHETYQGMAAKILWAFFPEFALEDIQKEVNEAYKSFDTKDVVKIKECDDAYFLELFHGPTLAFKDLALVLLPRLMKLAKEKLHIRDTITILTATSGDTGGAALNGFRDVEGVSIVVLYPNGGVSEIQEAQMCSFRGKNAKVLAIKGNFDDCQNFVKSFLNKHKELKLSSANSINIGRLVPQIVYYYYSYIYLVKANKIQDGEYIDFDVPTGNFGNIFAGYLAKEMGLPIRNLICASNKNAVLTDFFHTGLYDKNRMFYKTNSPSMDILISSNLERFLYYLSPNGEDINKYMELLKTKGEYVFPYKPDFIYAYSTDERTTLNIIKEIYRQYGYLIDPHTAVAYSAYSEYRKEKKDSCKTVIVSTASPYKFAQTVCEAFGKHFDVGEAIQYLKELGFSLPDVNYPPIQRESVDLEEAEEYVTEVIKCFM